MLPFPFRVNEGSSQRRSTQDEGVKKDQRVEQQVRSQSAEPMREFAVRERPRAVPLLDFNQAGAVVHREHCKERMSASRTAYQRAAGKGLLPFWQGAHGRSLLLRAQGPGS